MRKDFWLDDLPEEIRQKMIQQKISKNYERPSFLDTLAKEIVVISERSSCLFYNVASIIFREEFKQQLSIGYKGSVRGDLNCVEVGCSRVENRVIVKGKNWCRGGHAERNAIGNAALNGISTRDSEMICVYRPCGDCAKDIANHGIKKIYYLMDYDGDEHVFDLFKRLKINLIKYESKYFNDWLKKYQKCFGKI